MIRKPTEQERFFFSPEIPAEALDFSPYLRLAHDFPVGAEQRIFRKAFLGDHALHYFMAGTGTYELNSVTYPIEPGNLFLVRPGHGYCFRLTPGATVRMLNIHFDLDDLAQYACHYPCNDEEWRDKRALPDLWPDFQSIATPVRYEELFFTLLAAAGQSGNIAALQCKGRLLEILAFLLENRPGTYQSTPGAIRALHRALTQMRSNLQHDWNVTTLARTAGISRSLFSQICTQVTGLPPARLLLKERLQAAQFALLYTQTPLKEIAEQCGFANTQHFNRAFRKALGIPPGAFRNRHSNLDD